MKKIFKTLDLTLDKDIVGNIYQNMYSDSKHANEMAFGQLMFFFF